MKMIILHIHDNLPVDEAQVRQLLRDAIGEFITARRPIDRYVRERYAEQSPTWRERKVREVAKRIELAERLARGATLTVEED